MSRLYVIDTHTLLGYLDKHKRLSSTALEILNDSRDSFVLPAIALAEALIIIERERAPVKITEKLLLNAV